MDKAFQEKLLKRLNEKFDSVKAILRRAKRENSRPTTRGIHPYNFHYLADISDYFSYVNKEPILKKTVKNLLEIGRNQYGNYKQTSFGFSYIKLRKINSAVEYKENNRKIPKKHWNKPANEVMVFKPGERSKRVYYILLKQVENGSYNQNNPFIPDLNAENFEHLRRVHKKLVDDLVEMKPKKSKLKYKGFDTKNEVLKIGNYKIPFPQTSRKNGYAVFNAIQALDIDITEPIPSVEIEEEAKIYEGKGHDGNRIARNYYSVYKEINKQVQNFDLELEPIFIINTKNCQINPFYL